MAETRADENLIVVYQDEVHFQAQTTVTAAWFKKGTDPKIKSLLVQQIPNNLLNHLSKFPWTSLSSLDVALLRLRSSACVHENLSCVQTASYLKPATLGRSKVSYSGFLIQDSGMLFTCKPSRFNTSTTIESLRSFLATCPPPEGKKYAIVMDNASWHKAAKKAIGSGRLRHPAFYDISNYVVFIDMPPYSPDLNPIEQVWRVTRREFTHNRFFKSIIVLEGTTDRAFAEWAKPNAQLQSLCGFM